MVTKAACQEVAKLSDPCRGTRVQPNPGRAGAKEGAAFGSHLVPHERPRERFSDGEVLIADMPIDVEVVTTAELLNDHEAPTLAAAAFLLAPGASGRTCAVELAKLPEGLPAPEVLSAHEVPTSRASLHGVGGSAQSRQQVHYGHDWHSRLLQRGHQVHDRDD